MAAEIRVASAALRGKKEELEQLTRSFLETMGQLNETVSLLSASWEGETHDAFYQAFQKDKGKMELFAKTVSTYSQAMETIIAGYEAAEQKSMSLAQSRSY